MIRSRSSSAIALASRPGATALAKRTIVPALRRSASSASAIPGYWILTATWRPSSSSARCTWPIEAAAKASVSISAKSSDSGSPSYSSSSTLTTFSQGIAGASVRSLASCSW